MNDDVEKRLAAVELRVESEARLRASVDADLSRLEEKQRCTLEVVQAMQLTQVRHSALLNDHSVWLNQLRHAQMEQGETLAVMRKTQRAQEETLLVLRDMHVRHAELVNRRFAGVEVKLDAQERRCVALEAKVDRVLTLLEPPTN
jgi:hypothetical protein